MAPDPLELAQLAVKALADDQTMPDGDPQLLLNGPRRPALALGRPRRQRKQQVERLEHNAVFGVLEWQGRVPALRALGL